MPLTRTLKAGTVLGAFAAAVAAAWVVTDLYIAATPAVDRSGGMAAFGDGMLFLAALALFSIPALCMLLYALRSRPGFWRGLAALALVAIGFTVLAVAGWMTHSASGIVALGTLWLIFSPFIAGGFGLAALFAPAGPSRARLALSAGLHGAFFVCAFLWMTRYAG